MIGWMKSRIAEKIIMILLLSHMIWKVGYSYFMQRTSDISVQGANYIIENISTISDEKTVMLLEDISHISSTVSKEFFESSLITLLLFSLYFILLIVNRRK